MLKNVYAVRTPHGYVPRSEALDTKDEPKLWVNRSAAEERAKRRRRFGDSDVSVVEFRLIEVLPEENS